MRTREQPATTDDTAKSPHRATMRAIVQDGYGEDPARVLRLAQVDRPEPRDDEVLVRVQAAGLHRGDWQAMAGLPYRVRVAGSGLRSPRVRVRGMDVAGTVAAVGVNVTRFQPGSEVFGTCAGSFAEYATLSPTTLATKPRNLSFLKAATVPTSATAALQALRDAGSLEYDQDVLIVGASGGVGLFAVQIAKSLKAQVTGVCSAAKADLVRSVGADHVIDYNREDFTAGGRRFDLIIDLGGDRGLSRLLASLRAEGTLVPVGRDRGNRWIGGRRWFPANLLSRFTHRLQPLIPEANHADLAILAGLVESEQLRPVIDKVYPLEDVPSAMVRLNAGHPQGKIVIAVAD